MVKRTFGRDLPFLHLPVSDRDPETFLFIQLWDGERQVREFYLGLCDTAAGEPFDFYVAMDLGQLESETVTLVCEESDSPTLLDGIIPGKDMEEEPGLYPDLYHEKERQQIHFSPRRGWMNDPNGLLCTPQGYNIHFQHNPFGPHHGCANVSWGSALSADGVHYKEYPDAIMPLSTRCHIASGSAIMDRYNMSGFGTDTIIAAYTALQSIQFHGRPPVNNEGQHLLYSRDGGRTYRYFPWSPIIPVPEGEEWRDPKIVQVDDHTLCILVYETFEGRDCISFYISHDLKNWERVYRESDLFECPDLFPLIVEETGETKWVLYGGNGKYRIGDFRDFRFTAIPEEDVLYLDYGFAVYAGQTFNQPPDLTERRHLAWLSDRKRKWFYEPVCPERGKGYSQSMSLMCTLKLHLTDRGYRLFRAPIPELSMLRSGQAETVLLKEGMEVKAPAEYETVLSGREDFSLLLGDSGFSYEADGRLIRMRSGAELPVWMLSDSNKEFGKAYHLSGNGPVRIRFFTDRRSVEFFINEEISLSFSAYPDEDLIHLEGVPEMEGSCRELDSIWA